MFPASYAIRQGALRPICPTFSACANMQRRVRTWIQTASPPQGSPSAGSCLSSRRQNGLTSDAWSEWTGAPVKIFAGGKDNYDDRDPNACQEAIDCLPESARKSFSVMVYPSATHGWDQRRGANFYEKIACKGRGCYNINAPDAQVAQQSIKDLIESLGTARSAPSRK